MPNVHDDPFRLFRPSSLIPDLWNRGRHHKIQHQTSFPLPKALGDPNAKLGAGAEDGAGAVC